MSDVTGALLALLLSFPRYGTDTETNEGRVQRLGVVSVAIERAAQRATCTEEYAVEGCKKVWYRSPRELRMALVVVGKFESNFAQHIHEGRCRRFECDGGRAHSPWQVHWSRHVPQKDWVGMHAATQEATDLAAWHAAGVLSRMQGCPDSTGMFSLYVTGVSCNHPGGEERAKLYKRLLQE